MDRESRTVRRCTAVILAAGRGSRFGSEIPKQLASLAGHPVLHHTLRHFENASVVKQIALAVNCEWQAEIEEVAAYALRHKPYVIVPGGASRNASVSNALDALETLDNDDLVLVHDGVRPFVSEEAILRVVKALEKYRAVVPVVPSVDPLVRVQGQAVVGFEHRSVVLRGQSPQGFYAGDLRKAFRSERQIGNYETLFELLLSVDSAIEIGYVAGDLNNIKITTPADRTVAGQILLESI